VPPPGGGIPAAVPYTEWMQRPLIVLACVLCVQACASPAQRPQPLAPAAADRAEVLADLLRWSAPLQRVSRRLVLALPASDVHGPRGVGWGFYVVPADPAFTPVLGPAATADGYVVAWVDPEGPAAGRLARGDVIVDMDGRRLHRDDRFELADRLRVELGVERAGRRRKVIVTGEIWPMDVRFYLVDSGPPNAAPGHDFVVVTASMMELLRDDDEVAAVLAHELAHVTQGHPGRPDLLAAGVDHPDVGTAATLATRFSRAQEATADRLGISYAYRAGYRPEALLPVLDRLADRTSLGAVAGHFDSHGGHAERVRACRQTIAALPRAAVSR